MSTSISTTHPASHSAHQLREDPRWSSMSLLRWLIVVVYHDQPESQPKEGVEGDDEPSSSSSYPWFILTDSFPVTDAVVNEAQATSAVYNIGEG